MEFLEQQYLLFWLCMYTLAVNHAVSKNHTVSPQSIKNADIVCSSLEERILVWLRLCIAIVLSLCFV